MKSSLKFIALLVFSFGLQGLSRADNIIYCTQDMHCFAGQWCQGGICTGSGQQMTIQPTQADTVQQTAPAVRQSSPTPPQQPVQPLQQVNQDTPRQQHTLNSYAASQQNQRSRQDEPQHQPKKRIYIPLLLGIPTRGEGTMRAECDSSDALCGGYYSDYTSANLDDDSGLSLETGVLFPLKSFRLGLIGNMNFDTKLKNANNAETSLGKDLFIGGALEWAPRIHAKGHWLFTTRLGSTVLFPADDLEELNNSYTSSCIDARANGFVCEHDDGPYYGVTAGVGTGYIHELSSTNLRFQILATLTSTKLSNIKVSSGYTYVSETLSLEEWLRVQFQAGFEF